MADVRSYSSLPIGRMYHVCYKSSLSQRADVRYKSLNEIEIASDCNIPTSSQFDARGSSYMYRLQSILCSGQLDAVHTDGGDEHEAQATESSCRPTAVGVSAAAASRCGGAPKAAKAGGAWRGQ